MDNIILITRALEMIENNLTEEIRTDDIAKELYCSKSSIEKLFKYVTKMSIHDYLVRRRMSRAARDIVNCPNISLLDLAVKYGYGSNEAFTRAFKSVWFTTPSEYRNNPVSFELFPAFNLEPELMEDKRMAGRKKVDISELYDYIRERQNCYFVAVDIVNLVPINDISVKAGDIAILTAMSRLADAAGEEDIVFRIGGDEFVALTSSEDEEYVQNMVNEILSHNCEPIVYEDRKIPLSVYATYYKIEDKSLRYAELFSKIHTKLMEVKKQ